MDKEYLISQLNMIAMQNNVFLSGEILGEIVAISVFKVVNRERLFVT